jgi:glycosyltransferase involved in cell wall biosynthesis
MRIGVLSADLTHRHGWAHYSASLIAALKRAGADVRVVTTTDSPPCDEIDVARLLPPVDPLARGLLMRLAAAFPAARAYLRGCDIIHALIEPFAPLGAWIAGSNPFFVTAHGSYARLDRAYPLWSRAIYASAFRQATLVAVSRYTAEAARAVLPGVRVAVIENGVDVGRFVSIERTTGHPPTVLFVGAVKARKGVDVLIQAFALTRESIPEARLLIVGSLDAEPAYALAQQALAADLGLTNAVTFAGRVSDADLLSAYAAADVFALPSMNIGWKFEGFGLALMEASAAGLPVIGSRDCGAADAVQDGVTGLLVKQGDVEGLADALIRLLRDRELARRMGAAGRVFAQTHTWDAAAARLLALYEAAR